jgi:outer membrane murein-binding lipoprotein Lpp
MNQLKESIRIMMCLSISLLMLSGCGSSSSDKKQIEDLKGQIAELNNTVNDLTSQLSTYQNQSYENIYGGGVYQCQLETNYSLSIRFVAKTVVYFEGIDSNEVVIYHNYYLLEHTSTYNFDIVEDVNVADNWGPTNWAYIKRNGHFSRLEMSEDGKTLTLTPSNYKAVCTFLKD